MQAQPSFLNKSNFYFLVVLVILASTVAYTVMQFQVMSSMKGAVKKNEGEIMELQTKIVESEEMYRKTAEDFQERKADYLKTMDSILPFDAGYTDLARLFDNYFAEANRPGNPIEQNNLVFGQPAVLENNNSISVLPISMNITASRDNFLKFLKFVENSGRLESGIRLMEIKGINFSFENDGELVKDLKQEVSFSVRMNTYFRTPKVPVL